MTSRTVVAGTAEGLHLGGGDVELKGRDVRSLTSDGEGWWALADRTVWHGHPGQGWDPVTEITGPVPHCVLAAPHALLVGTAEARLLEVVEGEVRPNTAFDAAPGRGSWGTPWGGPPDTRSMTATPDGTLYVNVHVGGLLRSDDDGHSWEPTVDPAVDVHHVLVERGSQRLLIATGAQGLMVSPDGGASWEIQNDGLEATYLRALACTRDTLLVSASTGPGGGKAAVYRRPLGSDEPVERCRGGLPDRFPGNVDTGCLAGDDTLAAVAGPDGSLYASEDGGRTWEVVLADLPPPRCAAVVPADRSG